VSLFDGCNNASTKIGEFPMIFTGDSPKELAAWACGICAIFMPEEAAIPFPQATADTEQAARELANAKRRQRRVRKVSTGETRGKGRGNGSPLIPATPEEAKKNIDAIVATAVQDITKGKALPTKAVGQTLQMKAAVMAVLGENVEEARAIFADRLLATAMKLANRIDAEVEDLPANSLAFTAAVMIDKSEALRNKNASSAHGASVSVQINQFSDGSLDKQKLIDSLLGKFVPEVQAKPVDQA
jgi:hypothetical protein